MDVWNTYNLQSLANINFNNLATSNGVYGITNEFMTAGENLAAFDLVYPKITDSGKLYKFDSNGTDSFPGLFMVGPSAITSGNTGLILERGWAVNSGWSWSVASETYKILYGDFTTAGGLKQGSASPGWSAGDIVQVVGHVIKATMIYFCPNIDFMKYKV